VYRKQEKVKMIKYEVIVYECGTQHWYLNGELHREDGPAVKWADGTCHWYVNGKLHREDGPATIREDGTRYWWLNGKQVTEQEAGKAA
jgi:phenylpyruvate tautomerase PptA (4-oxalocrotonate tautomerase family)